ncbi:hypothetical protein BB559_004192, partial [Furculomyces boomerangus]
MELSAGVTMTGSSSKSKEIPPKTINDIPPKESTSLKMPTIFPGAPGAPIFDGEGLSEFLLYYEIITVKVSSAEKTMLFPYYCNANVRSKVTKSNAYIDRNWEEFKIVLGDYYDKEDDEHKINESIQSLISKGTSLKNIRTFLHQFEYLCKKKEKFSTTSDREKIGMLIK